jgi:hypothetical protein
MTSHEILPLLKRSEGLYQRPSSHEDLLPIYGFLPQLGYWFEWWSCCGVECIMSTIAVVRAAVVRALMNGEKPFTSSDVRLALEIYSTQASELNKGVEGLVLVTPPASKSGRVKTKHIDFSLI